MRILVMVVAMILTACGGGGGGNDAVPTPPPVPPAGPEVVAPAPSPEVVTPAPVDNGWLVFSPTSIQRSVMEGDELTIELAVSSSRVIDPAARIRFDLSKDLAGMAQVSGGLYEMRVKVSADAKPGRYTGHAKMSLCLDAVPVATDVCQKHQPGSPWLVPVALEVVRTSPNLTSLIPLAGGTAWSHKHGNAGLTNAAAPGAVLDPARFNVRWRQGGSAAQIITADGLAITKEKYDLWGSNYVRALREWDGSVVWQQASSAGPDNIVATSSAVFAPLSGPQRGTSSHRLSDGVVGSFSHFTTGQKNVTNGAVYARGAAGMFKLDAATLTTTWKAKPNPPESDFLTEVAFAVDGERLYVSDANGVMIFRESDGAYQAMLRRHTGNPDTAIAVSASDRIFVANKQTCFFNACDTLARFSADTRQGLWGVDIPSIHSHPAVTADAVYVVTGIGKLSVQARSVLDGSLLWETAIPGEPLYKGAFTHQIIAVGNMVFVSSLHEGSTGTYAVDTQSHKLAWSIPGYGVMALSGNGTLYISRPANNGGTTEAIFAVNLQ